MGGKASGGSFEPGSEKVCSSSPILDRALTLTRPKKLGRRAARNSGLFILRELWQQLF